jgi:hypothetical protein
MKMLGKIPYAYSLKFLDAYGLREKFFNAHALEFFYALHIVRVNAGCINSEKEKLARIVILNSSR